MAVFLSRALLTGVRTMRVSRRTGAVLLAAVLPMVGVLGAATASHAEISGRAGTIAFLSGADRTGVFAIEADGSGLRRLTPSGVDVASYEWSPDGRRLAYLDHRGALRLVRADGTGGMRLAANSSLRSPWMLTWSPDGKTIAVEARDPNTSKYRIYLISTGGGLPRRLPSGDVQSLDWSSRGDEIAYTSGSGLQRIIRTDGSKPRPIFRKPQTHGYWNPTWSPDATHIGFTGHVRHGSHWGSPGDWYDAIYVADADGSHLHLVTSHAYNEYGFAWSPDGRSILYGRAQRNGIYVIGADGRNNHKVTSDSPRPTEFGALTWAPDGRSIAYATDRTGNGDIYVIDANGHNKVRLTNTAANDVDPSWQPR